MQNTSTNNGTDELKLNDPRYDQLMDLAREGNEEAIADLLREYGYDYHTGKFSGEQTGMDGDDWIGPIDGVDDGGAE